jgi:Ca-activated chloride channel family protein
MRPAPFLVLAMIPAAVAAQQAPVFRSTVETVPIYATVMDASRRLEPDLTQEDFEVYDNRQLQPLTLFRSDVQPISVVATLDTSGSMTGVLDLVKRAAESFVIRLLPDDRARLGSFDDVTRLMPTFTSNRDDLVRYLHNEIRFGNGTRLWDAVDQAISALEQEQNRRVVLVLSDGDDTTSKSADAGDVRERAQKSDVMIYGIGLRVQFRGGPGGRMIQGRPDAALKNIVEHTGGGYFELAPTAELGATFSRVADELHRQYVLGFTPKTLDGKVHQLEVRVKQPGMTVRARKTYLAVKKGS